MQSWKLQTACSTEETNPHLTTGGLLVEIAQNHPVLISIVDLGCKDCDFMGPVVKNLVAANSETGLELVKLDAWENPTGVVEFEAMAHPTLILYVGGHERDRITGTTTKRQLLRKFLPYLYPDPDVALEKIRIQLDNPGEKLPSHEKVRRGSRNTATIGLLRQVPMFATMPKRQLGVIARYADETTGHAGQVLAVEGEVGDQFFLICKGAAVVRKNGHEIAKLGTGDFFGEMALLDGEPRSADVQLTEDAELLAIHRRDFDYLLDDVPGMARQMLIAVTSRLREADRKLVQ